MQQSIIINLPEELQAALAEATRDEGVSTDELVSKAINEYLFLRQLRLLRERMRVKAQAQGINTDQDVFDRVS